MRCRSGPRGERIDQGEATGGFATTASDPWQPQYGSGQLAAAVRRRAALPVTAHAHATVIAAAVAAGVDGIEHRTFLSRRQPPPARMLLAIVTKVRGGMTIPRVYPGMPGEPCRSQQMMANIRRLIDAGARVALSTDAGVAPGRRQTCP